MNNVGSKPGKHSSAKHNSAQRIVASQYIHLHRLPLGLFLKRAALHRKNRNSMTTRLLRRCNSQDKLLHATDLKTANDMDNMKRFQFILTLARSDREP